MDDEFDFHKGPVPAKKMLPTWYKEAEPFQKGRVFNPRTSNPTFKGCVPFLDALTTGYMMTLWMDLFVFKNKDTQQQEFTWNTANEKQITARSQATMDGFEHPEGHSKESLAIQHPLYIETPPGYSVLITHPFNRFDLPFTVLSGVVDTDKNPMFYGNYPFYIKKDFEGIIPAGTPLFQILPFKRESWDSVSNDKDLVKRGKKIQNAREVTFLNWYRKNSWSRKDYN